MSLEALLNHRGIWRGREVIENTLRATPTGYPALDAHLPGGGWPVGSLIELMPDHPGSGEMSLLLPTLAHLSRQGRWVVLIAPPHLPYAPALAAAGIDLTHLLLVRPTREGDRLWAMEQSLRSPSCSAALGWIEVPQERQLRRLQLAAEAGGSHAFLFRPVGAARTLSPAALRLRLEPRPEGLRLHLLKFRGGWKERPLDLPLRALA